MIETGKFDMKTKRFGIIFLISFYITQNIFAQTITSIPTLTGKSSVDWTENKFISELSLDTKTAGFKMPSNRNAASRRIAMRLPVLVKDPLLSMFVDSENSLDNLIREGRISFEELTRIIENGKKTADVFDRDGITMKTTNIINMENISKSLSRQRYATLIREPIDIISSRVYTGIIIDARGALPIHGEYVKSETYPCFFPKIWNTEMDTIYERAVVDLASLGNSCIVKYDWSDDRSRYESRVGTDPFFIRAEKVYGRNRTDPVIRTEDALRILTVPENRELLKAGKVVILLDRDNLIHDVSVPERNASYYALYDTVREYVYRDMTGVTVTDTIEGIRFSVDLKFRPDSSELLQSEYARLAQIAERLQEIVAYGEFTILIEGHTADIGRPIGQQNLSIERTRTVMRELVRYGIDESIFTYIGYGGNRPIADNDTEEGRAQNRRVDITARPRATYIQRD